MFRFASVSSKWRNFVKQDTAATQQRWKEFLGEREEYYDLKGKVISEYSHDFDLIFFVI